jgi:hypothetical protein
MIERAKESVAQGGVHDRTIEFRHIVAEHDSCKRLR